MRYFFINKLKFFSILCHDFINQISFESFLNPTSSLFVFFSTHLVGSNHKYLDWFCSLYRIVFWLLSLVQHMKLDIVDDVCFDEDDLIGILVNLFLFCFYSVSFCFIYFIFLLYMHNLYRSNINIVFSLMGFSNN